jgi:hypothetical protein
MYDSNGASTNNIHVSLPEGHTADYDLVEILKFGEGSVANVPMIAMRR